ncbi:phosphohistidine phosphatase SixA [candidate division TA06 bacterium]|uniref:Phosphohistidine phosphatase SixA n=1 Tax=candidate division TA06 bacterium TaxID=2250710 RepID=A0A523UWX5_UNCT6|nr:MAG: phosphohistidine phosphatase SixA [candidate division TA06 bacterium]
MKVYLVRHGEAASSNENPQRPLTHTGRKDTEKVAEFIGRLCLKVTAIEHSGKLRAQQTADILGASVELEEGVAKADGLTPNDDVEPWIRELSRAERDLMLVGHLPFLGRLASALLTGSQDPTIANFNPSTVLCLERTDEGAWYISWLLSPELLPST